MATAEESKHEMVPTKFVVAHSALELYRTEVEMAVPAGIAQDPEAIKKWLESGDARSGIYMWSDAFSRTDDWVDVKTTEIDGVDFDTK